MQFNSIRGGGRARLVALLGFTTLLGAAIVGTQAGADHIANVGTHNIKNNHVRSQDIRDGAVQMKDIRPSTREAFLQGGPQGEQGPPGPPGEDGVPVVVSTGDHGEASPPFAAADPIDSVDLGEGDWQITASGAANYPRAESGEGPSPNCGLREGEIMLAKQNMASEDAVDLGLDRGGFAVAGSTSVAEGETTTVELVCFGAEVFEHNVVAIGGSAAE